MRFAPRPSAKLLQTVATSLSSSSCQKFSSRINVKRTRVGRIERRDDLAAGLALNLETRVLRHAVVELDGRRISTMRDVGRFCSASSQCRVGRSYGELRIGLRLKSFVSVVMERGHSLIFN